jgi:hypothetical protein
MNNLKIINDTLGHKKGDALLIKLAEFLNNAFEYFATRKYDEKNVMNAYTTQYKKEQKDANLPNGIKFILDYVNKELLKNVKMMIYIGIN